jgi:hypothetical protein
MTMRWVLAAAAFALASCGLDLHGTIGQPDEDEDTTDDLEEGVDQDAEGESPCVGGETLCAGVCVDLGSDARNCGRCGNACSEEQVCADGACSSQCGEGRTDCGGSCVDTSSDVLHCGRCDNACPAPPHATAACTAGTCGFDCLPGWSDINGEAADGCEEPCEVTSPEEVCNGLDDNCDGTVDEGFPCPRGRQTSCTTTCGSTGLGLCSESCALPGPGDCDPPAETCNGLDDDCDGAPDDGFACSAGTEVDCTTLCGTPGRGLCTAACAIPTGSGCAAGEEVCNGEDDNCNGQADETFSCAAGAETLCATTCGSEGTGTCAPGCTLPPPESCTPPPESCNGLDDNCDGTCDEDFACCVGAVQTCVTSCGSTGSRTCTSGCVWGSCAVPAESCNGLDDDCDGLCDNGFGCCAGAMQACTTSCGSSGTSTCSGTCLWGACAASAETCNGQDDDCDGSCDNGFPCCAGATRTCTAGGCAGRELCTGSCAWSGTCDIGGVPVNDRCGDAVNVGTGGTFTGTTCGAANDYTSGCGSGANSPDVVYRVDLMQRSLLLAETCTGSAFDTVLTLMAGCPPTGSITCDNDACGNRSRIQTALDAGTYYIIVDGYGDASAGTFSLDVTVTPLVPPPNDTCAGAIDISAGGTFAGDSTNASTDPGGACRGNSRSGLWYRFTLAQREVVYLDTLDGNSWDSVITVRSGSCTGTEVLCGDDVCSTFRSQGAVGLVAGTYYVLVSGYYMVSYGAFSLRYLHSPCPGARVLAGGWNTGDTGTAGNDTTGSCGNSSGPDAPYYFTQCPGGHSVTMDLCDSRSWDSMLYLRSGGGGLCGNAEEDCNDDGCGPGVRSSLDSTLTGPGLFFVVVDGFNGSDWGAYSLWAAF